MTHNVDYGDEQARSGARKFDEVGSQLGAIVGRVNSELDGDSPWSDDELGGSFASKFDPDRRQVIANLKALAAKVGNIGSALKAAADRITTADNKPTDESGPARANRGGR